MNESTQFSMVEFRSYEAEGMPAVTDGGAVFKTPRHRAMAVFASFLETDAGRQAVAAVGGVSNLQRVRVFGPDPGGDYQFALVEKVPTSVLRERERKAELAERARKRDEYLAQLEVIKDDPEKVREFLTEAVVEVLSRRLAAAVMGAAKATKLHRSCTPKPRSRDSRRYPKPQLDPRKDFDAGWDAAVRQDYRRRVSAYHEARRVEKAPR